jgi:hypothetical protein
MTAALSSAGRRETALEGKKNTPIRESGYPGRRLHCGAEVDV